MVISVCRLPIYIICNLREKMLIDYNLLYSWRYTLQRKILVNRLIVIYEPLVAKSSQSLVPEETMAQIGRP